MGADADATPDGAGIHAARAESLDCWVQLGIAGGRVISLSFPDEAEPSDHELLDRLLDYLGGLTEDEFEDVTVGLTIGGPEREVLETLRDVPYGENVTVAQLARMVAGVADDDAGHATVRDALAGNPVPIFIPDHRVSDGPSAAPPRVEQQLRSLEGI
jgi:methylated-DNA-[protein]-cysteine S-methyltransferase